MNKDVGLNAFQRERARKQHRKAAGPILAKALGFHQAGIAADAQALCELVLKDLPDHFDALHLLGLSKMAAGQLAEAEMILQRALAADPRSADAFCNLGVVQFERGQFDKARSSYEKAIALRPNSPVALNNLGNTLIRLDRPDSAVHSYERSISLKPDYADAIYNRGNALLLLGRFKEAIQSFERAIALRPSNALAYNGRGLACLELKQLEDALMNFDGALRIKPDFPQALSNRGRVLAEIGQLDASLDSYARALAIGPALEAALLGQARVFLMIRRLSDAFANCRRALSVDPGSVEALTLLGQCLAQQGNIEEAISHFDRALAIKPDCESAITKKIFALDFDSRSGFAEHQKVRKQWWHHIGSKVAATPLKRGNVLDPDRRLAIGYVSSDFRDHSAALAFMPILRNHDRTSFEVACYSCSGLKDAVTDECRLISDRWIDASRMSDDELAEQIRSDGIDILVDLSGHSAGHRLGVFARKPVPVQVTAWGHGTGTGIPQIDYLFSDPFLIPSGFRHLFAEKIYDLPCAITIDRPSFAEPSLNPPCIARGHITYGVFNRIDKISADAVRVWCQILQAVPQSKLLIKHAAVDDIALRHLLAERFFAYGVRPDRIQYQGATSRAEHLAAYGGVDICLDPFPQNGGVSTWEALYLGVPVVAKFGGSCAGRAAGAILSSVGLNEWVADSDQQYAAIATKYASRPQYLKTLRTELPGKILNSAAGNTETYTRAVEAAYRAFWKEYCISNPGSATAR
jgi:predicted O-linked N-acetylglucosamine transferase (SPINDLY family)